MFRQSFRCALSVGLFLSLSHLVGCSSLPINSTQAQLASFNNQPLVIAHRGASGYLPEHTLEAAVMAFNQGADFIEQDLVVSKDEQLIVLHDIHLEQTTDVELKFPQRSREDGRFYAIDFTLAELKTLIVHERQDSNGVQVYPNRYTGTAPFRIATFEEQITLINSLNTLHNKTVGIYPEIKSPAWHTTQGKDISSLTLAMLRKYQLDSVDATVYLQCFDFNELKRIKNELHAEVKLIQLLAENEWGESDNDYDYLRSPAGLTEIATVANGIGPWFSHLVDDKTGRTKPLIKQVKGIGLKIHPYTFRVDQLPNAMTSDQTLDLLFNTLSVDGVFTDQTDVVNRFLNRQ